MREQRAVILSAAYHAHPEQFINKRPVPPKITTNSWINPTEEMVPSLSKSREPVPHLG